MVKNKAKRPKPKNKMNWKLQVVNHQTELDVTHACKGVFSGPRFALVPMKTSTKPLQYRGTFKRQKGSKSPFVFSKKQRNYP